MKCQICQAETEDFQHVNLYVNGSEGIVVCHQCRNCLIEFVKHLQKISARTKKEERKKNGHNKD